MEKPEPMNAKEAKQMEQQLCRQYGIEKLKLPYAFFKNPKGKMFAVSRGISRLDFSKLRINAIGMYFAKAEEKGGIRLTVEGSQMIGKHATKNVAEITPEQAEDWMRGNDVAANGSLSGFVLLKCGDDFFGCGKYSDGKVFNFVPKERRVRRLSPAAAVSEA